MAQPAVAARTLKFEYNGREERLRMAAGEQREAIVAEVHELFDLPAQESLHFLSDNVRLVLSPQLPPDMTIVVKTAGAPPCLRACH